MLSKNMNPLPNKYNIVGPLLEEISWGSPNPVGARPSWKMHECNSVTFSIEKMARDA